MGRIVCFLFLIELSVCYSQTENKLIWVKAGRTTIGNLAQEDAQPLFQAKIDGFWIQQKEVSNAEFKQFVEQTGYTTLAERNNGSYVFNPLHQKDSLTLPDAPWWRFEVAANWKHPYGINSTIDGTMNHPVVHIAFEDACAYCEWLGMRLPTEIEREFVAQKNEEKEMNNWQGEFPDSNQMLDNYFYTAPCGCFPSGKLGIYDLSGNVWEWCQDPYHQNAYYYAKTGTINSQKPITPTYFDLNSPDEETRVIRGGSFLCSKGFCEGYLPSTRMRSSVKMTFSHIGFRCVKSKK